MLSDLDRKILSQEGFLLSEDVDEMAKLDRLRACLIRFGACRCVAPAQNVKHIVEALEAAGDYCRDVSLPTTDPVYRQAPQ